LAPKKRKENISRVDRLPRDLPVANDQYLVMFDRKYQVADIYYPHVGMENHALGHAFRFGVFVDGTFSWTSDWTKRMRYLDDALVTDVNLENEKLGIKLHCNDCVDMVSPIFLRSIEVSNLRATEREIRLFFAQDFHLKGRGDGDTAYYDPNRTKAIIHYKTDTYFLMNSLTQSGEGIFQYACGVKEVNGAIGTWKDAEDGFLSGNPIAQGSVDSVFSVKTILPPSSKSTLYYWMIAGKSYDEVERRNSFVKARTPQSMIKRTADFWRLWVGKEHMNFVDLDQSIVEFYKRSLLTVRSQMDANGAIIAANDSDTLQFSRDTYSYMWPRDASFITMALDEAGYSILALRFFNFCSRIILPQGWYFHKYQPDGSLGSSWHPWIIGNEPQLPLQEDETTSVVIALWRHFERNRDVDFIKPFYRPVVKNAGNFMLHYRDPVLDLPLESYDLWEERRGVFTYTASSVYAGLVACSNFAQSFGELDLAKSYANGAEETKQAIIKNLYDPAIGRFLRGCSLQDSRVVNHDLTVDASLAGVFLFGLLPADDVRVVETMKQVEEKLSVKTKVGGIARYEQDKYQALANYDSSIPGNPWFICTLWLARWHIDVARSRNDLDKAKEIMNWAMSHAFESGIMAEQLNPQTGEVISVSPLTWSHGVFIDCVNSYIRKYKALSQA
jgi:glucoamylase